VNISILSKFFFQFHEDKERDMMMTLRQLYGETGCKMDGTCSGLYPTWGFMLNLWVLLPEE